MRNNKGLTLIETLFALFILGIVGAVCGMYFSTINRGMEVNRESRQIARLAKNKMEEIKSGHIYIEGRKYYIGDLGNNISFEEGEYRINISVKAINNHTYIRYVDLQVEDGNKAYNLVRYVKLQ